MASDAMGAIVAFKAAHHKRPLRAIEGKSTPFMTMFFLLAGFQFDVSEFLSLGLVGSAYIIFRSAGLILGG